MVPRKLKTESSLSTTSTTSELTPLSSPLTPEPLPQPIGLSEPTQNKTAFVNATSRKRSRRTLVKTEVKEEEGDASEAIEKPRKRIRRTRVDTDVKESIHAQEAAGETETIVGKKVTRKRKSKKDEIIEPLQPRTVGSKLCVGPHVSASGGIHNAIINCVHVGANAFALFLKSQRKWENPSLEDEHVALFASACDKHSISKVGAICLPHGSYLVNLAHTDPARTKQAYASFLDDLTRCHRLGINLYNFHPGNANSTTHEDGITHIARNLNRAHKDPATGSVITLLETMATLGNTIGGRFEDLAAIIDLVEDKSRVGVCLDTCHVFAAGYDLRTPEAFADTLAQFDKIIGLKYLKALHINDSKAPFGSYRDLHANIGTGYLGLRAFHNIVNDSRLWGLPMILETPVDVPDPENPSGKKIEDKGIWAREIKLLESLVGMDVSNQGFLDMEAQLEKQGKSERERVGDQVERKKAKDEKKAETMKAKEDKRKAAAKAKEEKAKKGPIKGKRGDGKKPDESRPVESEEEDD